jgi:retron-type reverse transcriptase
MIYVTKQRHITKPALVNIFITLPDDNWYFKNTACYLQHLPVEGSQ